MAITFDLTGALPGRVPGAGLDHNVHADMLAAARKSAERLAYAQSDGSLRLLNLAAERGDLEGVSEAAEFLAHDATDILLLGTGGSSLGGQALAQVAGWNVNGVGDFLTGPRLHFLDNLDPISFEALLSRLPLTTTKVMSVSKSGGTAETLFQSLIVIEAMERALSKEAVKDHVIGLTEPRDSALMNLLSAYGCQIFDHDTKVGGRYTGLTNVGLIPAKIMGLDPVAIREGAEAVLADNLGKLGPAGEGAALMIAYEKAGFADTVLWAYADRLERFTAWYGQLWAESLGKDGNGTSPIRVTGPVDQHSLQQLFLGGPNNRVITMIQTEAAGKGPVINRAVAETAGVAFGGRSVGDLVDAMQRATAETLINNQRPTRLIKVKAVDERAIGALMMHFFLETIIAGDCLGVDPFDQPAVEEGKVLARDYLAKMG